MREEFGKRAWFSDVAKLRAEGDQVLYAAARGAAKDAGLRAGIAQLELLLIVSRC